MSKQSTYIPPSKRAKQNSTSDTQTDVMGYFFSFDVEEKTEDALLGKYKSPVYEKIIPSTYGMRNPAIIREYIQKLYQDTSDIYIIGIKYKNKDPNDSQPTITGKTKGSESFTEAALREISEEIGAICEFPPEKENKEPSYSKRPITKTFILPVSKIKPLEKISKPVGNDNPCRRVEIVLYGTIDEITTALKQIKMRHLEEKDIMGVMAFPFDLAK